MPRFGERSRARLATIEPRLRGVLIAVMSTALNTRDDDFSVLTGRRGKADQDEAVALGRSHASWPDSAHNCALADDSKPPHLWAEDPDGLSLAVDLAPYPIDWQDVERFHHLAGRVMQQAAVMDVGLRWGGDFRHLKDLGHFELVE